MNAWDTDGSGLDLTDDQPLFTIRQKPLTTTGNLLELRKNSQSIHPRLLHLICH